MTCCPCFGLKVTLPWVSKPLDPLAFWLSHMRMIDFSDSPVVPHLLTPWLKHSKNIAFFWHVISVGPLARGQLI